MNYYLSPLSKISDSGERIPFRIRVKVLIGFCVSMLIALGMALSCVISFYKLIYSKNPDLIRSNYVLGGVLAAVCIVSFFGVFSYRIFRFSCFWSLLLLTILCFSAVVVQFYKYGNANILLLLVLAGIIIGFLGSIEAIKFRNRKV